MAAVRITGMTGPATRSTLGGMSMVITLPDEAAERVSAAAAARGVAPEAVVVELVMTDLPAGRVPAAAVDALEAFLGSSRGDGTPFEIHEARRDLAARKWAAGIENL
jgi:hypothetical protein